MGPTAGAIRRTRPGVRKYGTRELGGSGIIIYICTAYTESVRLSAAPRRLDVHICKGEAASGRQVSFWRHFNSGGSIGPGVPRLTGDGPAEP
jgi:hypothetical protein